MSETRKLFESYQNNLNEIFLGQEKEELFSLIKQYNPKAKKETYKKYSINQMISILTKLKNKNNKNNVITNKYIVYIENNDTKQSGYLNTNKELDNKTNAYIYSNIENAEHDLYNYIFNNKNSNGYVEEV